MSLTLLLLLVIMFIGFSRKPSPVKDNLEVDEKTFIDKIIDNVRSTNDKEDNLANKVADVVTKKNEEFDYLADTVAKKVSTQYCKGLQKNQKYIMNKLDDAMNNQQLIYDYLMKDVAPRTYYGYKNPKSIPVNDRYPQYGTLVEPTNSNPLNTN